MTENLPACFETKHITLGTKTRNEIVEVTHDISATFELNMSPDKQILNVTDIKDTFYS